MKLPALSLVGAAACGFLAAGLLFSSWSPRPAQAQGIGQSLGGAQPPGGIYFPNNNANAPAMPQPIAVQALDGEHFVVVSREVRLVQPIGKEGAPAQQMLVTVVTHYSVKAGRLVPVESVKVPTGYRAVVIQDDEQ